MAQESIAATEKMDTDEEITENPKDGNVLKELDSLRGDPIEAEEAKFYESQLPSDLENEVPGAMGETATDVVGGTACGEDTESEPLVFDYSAEAAQYSEIGNYVIAPESTSKEIYSKEFGYIGYARGGYAAYRLGRDSNRVLTTEKNTSEINKENSNGRLVIDAKSNENYAKPRTGEEPGNCLRALSTNIDPYSRIKDTSTSESANPQLKDAKFQAAKDNNPTIEAEIALPPEGAMALVAGPADARGLNTEPNHDEYTVYANSHKFGVGAVRTPRYVVRAMDNTEVVVEGLTGTQECRELYRRVAQAKNYTEEDFMRNAFIVKLRYDVLRPEDRVSSFLHDREEQLFIVPGEESWCYGDLIKLKFSGTEAGTVPYRAENVIKNRQKTTLFSEGEMLGRAIGYQRRGAEGPRPREGPRP